MITVSIERTVAIAPAAPSPRVLECAAIFGLGAERAQRLTTAPPTSITIPSSGIVFITGPSGGGKSTLLTLIEDGCCQQGARTIRVNNQEHSDRADAAQPLLDLIGESFDDAASLLSLVGLGDAFVMTRQPWQLSDGQRHRFEMARAFEAARRSLMRETELQSPSSDLVVIFADEFCSMLDRLTAQCVARSARRLLHYAGPRCAMVCATAHDDLLEALHPDVLVWKGHGPQIEVVRR